MVVTNHAVHVLAQHGAARQKGTQGASGAAHGDDGPAQRKAVDEAGHGGDGRVADEGRNRRQEDERKYDEPAAGQRAPGLPDGGQPGEEAMRVHERQYAQHTRDDETDTHEQALQRREAQKHLDHLLAEELGRSRDALQEGRIRRRRQRGRPDPRIREATRR